MECPFCKVAMSAGQLNINSTIFHNECHCSCTNCGNGTEKIDCDVEFKDNATKSSYFIYDAWRCGKCRFVAMLA